MPHAIIDQLEDIPDDWALVAVGNDKRPYMPEWQKRPLTKQQVSAELESGRAVAVGVIAGPASGGLLFVDHDGLGASQVLETLGTRLSELPKSWAVTSGRDGRLQIIYRVPEPYWEQIRTTKLRSTTKGEQLELRWAGCQSVVIGKHPITGAYRWLPNRAPGDLPIAEAPSVLIQEMLRTPSAPLLHTPSDIDETERARAYLDNIPASAAEDYDEWLKVGMALHSVGDDALLADWVQWSSASGKFKPGECELKWQTFKSDAGGVGLGTLHHMAGGLHPRKAAISALKAALGPTHEKVLKAEKSSASQMLKLEPDELLRMLRQQLGDRLRYNIFTHNVEIDGRPVEDLEHYYLQLADQAVKASKELASDSLVYIARENQFDPVRAYLDDVADRVEPASIDHIASKYLRPSDQPGSMYDEMLRCTLIAAVRRIYEPGAKHDAATVLMGAQGCGKSTFWRNLGGPFFSDALRDVSSKDDLMVLHRCWLMEWAELDHITGKRHAGQVKAFLSQQTDTFRVPYGKTTEDFPRRSIIVGSTNRESGFLVDDTGNRRFWVIPVTVPQMIEVDELLIQRDAIWAGAVAAYKAGDRNFLSNDAAKQVESENATYLVESPWLAPIREWLNRPINAGNPVTTEQLLTEAVGKPVERQSRADQMQVASILRDMGATRKRQLFAGAQKWVYCLPEREG